MFNEIKLAEAFDILPLQGMAVHNDSVGVDHRTKSLYCRLIFNIKSRSLEAAIRWCLSKWVFLKISQNSQENTCVGVSL